MENQGDKDRDTHAHTARTFQWQLILRTETDTQERNESTKQKPLQSFRSFPRSQKMDTRRRSLPKLW